MIQKIVMMLAVWLFLPFTGYAQTLNKAHGFRPVGTFFLAGGRAPDGQIPSGSWSTIEVGGGTEWVKDYRRGVSFGLDFSLLIPATRFTATRPVLSANTFFNLPRFGLDERLVPRRIHLGIVATEHPVGVRDVSWSPGLSYGIGTLMGEDDGAAAIEFRGRVFRDGNRLTQSWGIRASVLNVFQ